MGKKYFVAKTYNSMLPTLVESFPFTEQGYKDAKVYAEIMSRTKGGNYIILEVVIEKEFQV